MMEQDFQIVVEMKAYPYLLIVFTDKKMFDVMEIILKSVLDFIRFLQLTHFLAQGFVGHPQQLLRLCRGLVIL